jgi:hypothetical protein
VSGAAAQQGHRDCFSFVMAALVAAISLSNALLGSLGWPE